MDIIQAATQKDKRIPIKLFNWHVFFFSIFQKNIDLGISFKDICLTLGEAFRSHNLELKIPPYLSFVVILQQNLPTFSCFFLELFYLLHTSNIYPSSSPHHHNFDFYHLKPQCFWLLLLTFYSLQPLRQKFCQHLIFGPFDFF